MNKTEWRAIEGFEKYQASSSGNIRNAKTKHVLVPTLLRCGYLYVKLFKEGKHHSKSIHRLIAKTFLGDPGPKYQVNHINGIKTDNRVCNLEWVLPKDNIRHAMENGLFNPIPPINKTKRVRIVEIGKVMDSVKECAEYLGVTHSAISTCIAHSKHGDHTCRGYHLEFC